jgi:hypothetical protein
LTKRFQHQAQPASNPPLQPLPKQAARVGDLLLSKPPQAASSVVLKGVMGMTSRTQLLRLLLRLLLATLLLLLSCLPRLRRAQGGVALSGSSAGSA